MAGKASALPETLVSEPKPELEHGSHDHQDVECALVEEKSCMVKSKAKFGIRLETFTDELQQIIHYT